MAQKISARQQAQLAFLQRLPAKIQRVGTVVEMMNAPNLDDNLVRGMIRTLDEIKSGASQLGMNGLADAAGQMAATARRGGAQMVKVRGLRDQLWGLRTNYDAAMKKAVTPEDE